ncbi:unnamed protein product [Litomosoides sigmodontis]|uniref:Uncharacterized protein n=1 Tax=Litomosoides sigmodontis TaxID=42156 RepID=A0A3P7K3C2_LITSI|nr:unnamed protein product [Litomosoides sigmodontis]
MNVTVKKNGNSCDVKSGRNIYAKASDNIGSATTDTASNDCKHCEKQSCQRQRQRHHVQRGRNYTQQHSTILQTRILSGEILNSSPRFFQQNTIVNF